MNTSSTGDVLGNVFLALSVLSVSLGHFILKIVMMNLPQGNTAMETFRSLLVLPRFWQAALSGSLIVAGFVFWSLCLRRLPLSYAYPLACSSALVVAFFSVLFLGEPASWKLWTGAILIVLGSALVSLS